MRRAASAFFSCLWLTFALIILPFFDNGSNALAYDCTCYTAPPNTDCMAGGQGADSEEYFDSNNPWCACTYYGEDVCDDGGGGTGGLTEEQIAALEALAEALENAQNNANAAATDLASLNSLLESLESVKATFLTAEDNVIQSLADINDSLDLLNGYLEVGQALNDEALDVINQQIATALINRGIAETINRECQGTTIGDPVLLASGVEDYKKTDLSYEVVNSLVKIQRRYRSNRNEEVSSFGKGWFFNYDSKVIAGRKPFIKERQELTQQLSAEAADLAAKAEAALDDVFSALDNANYWMEVVSGKQSEIDGIIAQIAPLVNEINGHASASQAAANEAAAQAAIADIPEAYTDANSAQSAASQAASCAASSAAKEQSADDIQVELAIILQYMEDDMAQAGVKAETSQHREARIGEIESFLLAQASEATEEADREEELFPDNPYPSDPTVYFGAGYLKILDENGSPILYQADDDGLFRPISDDGSYTGHIEQLEGGYKYISKHGEVRLFADNGDGTSRLVRDIDLNGNPTNYHYTNGKVSAIGDVFGRVTRIRYNAQGFINSVTDPQGYTYGYLYENQRLATYIDPAGSKWKYSYDNHGNLSGRTDPHGNTYRYFYDDKNRVIKEVDKEGYAITYTYDPENRVTTMTDRRGEETAYYYNESHRLVRTLYPDNSEVRYGYDDRNNRDMIIDENGDATNISYNRYNDVVQTVDAMGNITSITYDPVFNKVSSVTDPLGRTTQYSYDGHGNIRSITNPDNTEKHFEYNSYGLRTSATDENGNTTAFTYDSHGHLAGVTHPDGTSRRFTNDILGRVTEVIDENGYSSSIEYDPFGQVTRTVDPLGAETAIEYDALHRRIQLVDARGNARVWGYSSRGDLTVKIDPLGNRTSHEYDGERNTIKTTFPNGTGVDYTCDSRNRLVEELTFPGLKPNRHGYDAKGQLVSTRDAENNVTGAEYDALGRVIAKIDAAGYRTENSYDAVGNLIAVTDANGNSQQYQYDLMDRQVQHTDPLGNSTAFVFSPTGKLLEKLQPNGTTITYEYDLRDRLIEESASDGTSKSFEYDRVGRKTKLASESSLEQRYYDARGQLISVVDKYMGEIDYSYDLVGNRVQMIDPYGAVHSYRFDKANRLVEFTDPEGGKTHYEYDEMGRVTYTSSPNSTETITEYDEDNRIASIVSYSDKEEVLSSFSYTYDGVGNRLSMTDENGGVTTYRYDSLYRVIGVDYPSVAGTGTNGMKNHGSTRGKGKKKGHNKNNTGAGQPSLVSYAYDPVGNRLSKTEDGSTTSYQYNAANQMLRAGEITYAYDANGNRIGETGLDGEAQYEYNANNFLVEYTSAEGRSTRYGYDGLNRRVYKAAGKNVLESYLYDGLDVLLELAGPKGQHATTYYRANGRIVAQQKFSAAGNNGGYRHRPEGRRLYYTYDGLGSVASLSNHKGKSKTRYVYDVFGEVLSGDLKENTYTFTGKRFDMENGTYHFHFRQYDAKVGVWTTPDPIGILGGINLYSYVMNNPINRADMLGLHTGGYGGPGGDPEGNEMPDGNHHDSNPSSEATESFNKYWVSKEVCELACEIRHDHYWDDEQIRHDQIRSLFDLMDITDNGPRSGQRQIGEDLVNAVRSLQIGTREENCKDNCD